MSVQNLTLALDFCDGLRRWVEQPQELRIQEPHLDVPGFIPPAELKGSRDYAEKYPLELGLKLCLFPLNRDESGKINCVSWTSLEKLIELHGTEQLVSFFQAAKEPVDAATLQAKVHVQESKAMVPVKHFGHQIKLMGIFADHGQALEKYYQAKFDKSIEALAQRSAELAESRKKHAHRWMEFIIARGTTESAIEMFRSFRRLADKPEILGRCIAGAEDLAIQLRPPIEAALSLKAFFSGCGSRRSEPGSAFLRDSGRFLTLCQELKTRLERQKADVEGQMENLVEDNQVYCLYGGSHLAMKVMARVREYRTFDLLVIENEAEAISKVRGKITVPRDDWQVIRLSELTPQQKEMLRRVKIVFAGVACSVPQGAYVETGLIHTIRRLRKRNTGRKLPELALVVGGHKFVREQIGDPRYYEGLLAPFHEYLTYDKVRYLVG